MGNTPAYNPPVLQNNIETQLLGAISAAATSIVLKSGEGAELETITRGEATATGDDQTLTDTGDLGSLAVGDIIENLTDGSIAIVRDITGAPNSVKTTPLEGGTANIWEDEDVWIKNAQILTLTQFSSGVISKQERVKVVDRASDTLTVERGYGGDTAQAFNADDYLYGMAEETSVNELRKFMANALIRFHEIEKGERLVATTTGSSDAYVATVEASILALSEIENVALSLKANFTNSGAATINVNGLGAVAIKKPDGAGALTDVEANDIFDSFMVAYNGTFFVMLSAVALAGGAAALTISNKTADYTVSAANDIAKVFTNLGSTGEADAPGFTLPTPEAGLYFRFVCAEDEFLFIKPETTSHEIWNGTTQYGFGLRSNAKQSVIELFGIDATTWVTGITVGTWADIPVTAYWLGGDGATTTIQKMDLVSETISNSSSTLTGACNNAATSGNNTIGASIYGTGCYFFHLYTEETWTGDNTIAVSLNYTRGCCDATNGYAMGGNSPVIDEVHYVAWADESTGQYANTLNAGFGNGACVWDDTYAFMANGGLSTSNAMQRWKFSDQTDASVSDVLSDSAKGRGGHINDGNTNGYFHGGDISGRSTAIEELVFSTEIASPITGTLNDGRQRAGGLFGDTKGYCGGGDNSSNVQQDDVDDIVFSAGTSARISDTLTANTRHCDGVNTIMLQ